MANELRTIQSLGLVVYFQLRDGLNVWDNVAGEWVPLASATWANTAIAATHVGGGLYAGDFPALIEPGWWLDVLVFERLGATAAAMDRLSGMASMLWDGAALDSGQGLVERIARSSYRTIERSNTLWRFEGRNGGADEEIALTTDQTLRQVASTGQNGGGG